MKLPPVRVAVILLCLILGLALAGAWFVWSPHDIVLTRSDLQREVERKFPIEKRELIALVRFTDPKVILEDGSDRVGLGVSVTLEAPGLGKPLTGRLEADGMVRYEPSRGELYMDGARLRKLEAKGLTEQDSRAAATLLSPLLASSISHIPLYRLNPNDPGQAAARAVVRSVSVRGGKVYIRMGPE